jgi:hypothetical protein
MKRILTLTALMTTMATGAAYAAAPGELAPATQDAPVAYQGTWAMFVDGRFAAPLAGVEGCDKQVVVAVDQAPLGTDKHPAGLERPDCTVSLSLNMSRGTMDWIARALGARPDVHDVQLVRTDAKGTGLTLRGALITELGFPKLDAGGKDPAYLRVSFDADDLKPGATAAGAPGDMTLVPFLGITSTVQLDGVALPTAQTGALKIKFPTNDTLGSERDYVRVGPPDIGDLSLRIPEQAVPQVEPWWTASFAGAAQERKLTIAYTDGIGKRRMMLTLNNTAPFKADLAPRTDGNRGVSLYSEGAAIELR